MAATRNRGEMPFLDHLEELRWRILWSLLALVVGTGVGIWAAIQLNVMDILTSPLYTVIAEIAEANPEFAGVMGGGRLVFLNLTEPFFFILKVGVLAGIILSSPIVGYQLWAFLAPALEDRERRMIVPALAFGMLLFGAGVAMAYFIALPVTIRFLLLFGAEWFTPALTAGYYLSLVVRLLLAFGVVFELPVIVSLLSFLGIVTPAFLRSKRRHAIVLITVLASFLTPGDLLTVTVLLMLPLIVLYEVSIALSVVIYRKRDAEDLEDERSSALEQPEGSVSQDG